VADDPLLAASPPVSAMPERAARWPRLAAWEAREHCGHPTRNGPCGLNPGHRAPHTSEQAVRNKLLAELAARQDLDRPVPERPLSAAGRRLGQLRTPPCGIPTKYGPCMLPARHKQERHLGSQQYDVKMDQVSVARRARRLRLGSSVPRSIEVPFYGDAGVLPRPPRRPRGPRRYWQSAMPPRSNLKRIPLVAAGEARNAAARVRAYSRDTRDLRTLMDMCGLVPDGKVPSAAAASSIP
jgi:hypothetical protein